MPSTINMTFSELFQEFSKDDLIYWFIPIFILAMVIELIINRRQQLELYHREDSKASLWIMAFTVVVELPTKLAAFVAFYYLHEFSPFRDIIQRQWWAWLLLFFLDDFVYYWFHRMNHEVRLFWAGHVSHHSAIKMNFATALRQGLGERFHKFFYWMPLAFLGFDPLMLFTMMAINLFYQFWLHTELLPRFSPFVEFIFNTPSHHRVHHGSNIRYLDCNHAGVFILWDRLFGTISEEKDDEKPVYGLTENLSSHKAWHVATHEYTAIYRDVKNAKKWSDKLKYIFYAPGWRHDGPDKRAKVMRQAHHISL